MVRGPRRTCGPATGWRAGWLVIMAAVVGLAAAGLHAHSMPAAEHRLASASPAPAATTPARPAPAVRSSPSPSPSPPAPPTLPPTPPPAPPPARPSPPAAPAVLGPAPLTVEPWVITETVAAGTAYSPLIELTVSVTGHAPVSLGVITTTVPAFQVVRDGCSRMRMAPGEACHLTLQLAGAVRGHHTGALVIPVAGARAATARLDGTVA